MSGLDSTHLAGVGLAMAASILGGSTLVPMKAQRGWRFENTWLIYSIAGYFLSPWILGLLTIPRLFEVYAACEPHVLLITALCGFGWGFSVVLNGYAFTLLGLALTKGLLMGSSIAIGSLAPLLLLSPGTLLSWPGARLMAVNLALMGGVLLCAWAGDMREDRLLGKSRRTAGQARKGMLLCLVAGVVSTLFNVALSYGASIAREAVHAGAPSFYSSNAVWAIAASSGAIPGLIWSLLALGRRSSWVIFRKPGSARNFSLCLVMGVLWISGTFLYGAATRLLGPIGPAVGWPVYMSGMILTGAFWGWITGEWRGAEGAPVHRMMAGIGVQIVCLALIGIMH